MSGYRFIVDGQERTAKTLNSLKDGIKFFEATFDGYTIYRKTRRGKRMLAQTESLLDVYIEANNSK